MLNEDVGRDGKISGSGRAPSGLCVNGDWLEGRKGE